MQPLKGCSSPTGGHDASSAQQLIKIAAAPLAAMTRHLLSRIRLLRLLRLQCTAS
jgi:hypothetical protein